MKAEEGGNDVMNINECMSRFDGFLKACGAAQATRESYRRTLTKLEKFLELSERNDCEVAAIRKEDIIGFLAACEEAGEKRSSIIFRLKVVKKFFGRLKGEGFIATDPAATIPVPKEARRIPRYAGPQQIESLLDQPDTSTPLGLRDHALMELLYSAGLRISEALAIEIGDIDHEQGFVYVRNGKGGRPRNVPVGETALLWLDRYIRQGRRNLESDCSELVFLSRSGGRLSRQSAAAAVRGYAASAGLPDWMTPHLMRHAFATHLLQGGAGLAYIQEMLGHARPESTRIYTLVRSEDLKVVHTKSHPRR
jgi:integrase/recombinase XerD